MGLQCTFKEADKSSILEHTNSLNLKIDDLLQTSLQLRRPMVEEWTRCNKSYYEKILVSV